MVMANTEPRCSVLRVLGSGEVVLDPKPFIVSSDDYWKTVWKPNCSVQRCSLC